MSEQQDAVAAVRMTATSLRVIADEPPSPTLDKITWRVAMEAAARTVEAMIVATPPDPNQPVPHAGDDEGRAL